MSEELAPGLHEALITGELQSRIEAALEAGWAVEWKGIDDASLPKVLARFVHDQVLGAAAALPSSAEDRRGQQIAMANRLLAALSADPTVEPPRIMIEPGARVLLEVKRPLTGFATRPPTQRPGIPLSESVLLTNGHRDLQIGTQVALEIQSATRIDLLCAFVKFAGVRMIRKELQEFLLRGNQMRVITTVYTGSTDRKALDELVGFGASVKVSYDTSQTRLHAKSWLFERETGFHTAYVGSSNLTQWALLDGLEWNVRATQVDNPSIISRIAATFEQYWNEPEFESYDPRRDGARLQAALDAQKGAADPTAGRTYLSIDVQPKPFQLEILEALSAERGRGHFRNLVVAPTGTGKTWVSAFDYRRLRAAGYERLLFVAHRDEILRQTREVFRVVLDDPAFGERHVGSERPVHGIHVFASIQSLHRYVDDMDPTQWDVVIIDEFHHAEAPTYRRLLERLRPRVLVGLTATPERADGQDILHWFDERIGSEMRLWEALDQGLLCPFHYLGIGDDTDLRGVRFERGRYVTADLEAVYTGDHVRARRILEALHEWVLDPATMRALGFCVSVAHAHFMAAQFNAAGLSAVALDGSTESTERIEAVEQLRRGEIRAIFTVDIFNEGVDIPEVDTILLLRPTESSTIFLQQLGRGLRWSEGKSVLTVLDFVGQAHADYRFDIKYRALIGGTRKQVEQAIEAGFPLMPPGCAIRLDEIAQKIVLDNVRSSIRSTRKALIDDLRALPSSTTLSQFLAASSFELTDVYSNPSGGTTFASARRSAGHIRDQPSPAEAAHSKVLGRMMHVDDDERYIRWRDWLADDKPPALPAPGSRDERLQWMLFAALHARKRPLLEVQSAIGELWGSPVARQELIELLDIAHDQSRLDTVKVDPFGAVPIHSHATYGLYEIVAAYGLASKGVLRELREGVAWAEGHQTDLFFVTINKSDEDYTPTTRYQDYPISPTLFQWESQSKTASTSATGRRYIEHAKRGSRVLMFVRQDKVDERGVSAPYISLGYARYVSHQFDRPMRIVWELDRPMPAEIFQAAKVAAG